VKDGRRMERTKRATANEDESREPKPANLENSKRSFERCMGKSIIIEVD
jgi:hypothetical protein